MNITKEFFIWFAFFVIVLIVGAIVLSVGIKTKEQAERYNITSAPGIIDTRSCDFNYCVYKVEYFVDGQRYETILKEFCTTLPQQSKVGTSLPVVYTVHHITKTPQPLDMVTYTLPFSNYSKTIGTVLEQSMEPRKGCVYNVTFEFNGKTYKRQTISTNSLMKFEPSEKVNILFYPSEVETGKIAINSPNRVLHMFDGSSEGKAKAIKEHRDILDLETHPEYNRLKKKGQNMVIAGAVLTSFGGFFILLQIIIFTLQIVYKKRP